MNDNLWFESFGFWATCGCLFTEFKSWFPPVWFKFVQVTEYIGVFFFFLNFTAEVVDFTVLRTKLYKDRNRCRCRPQRSSHSHSVFEPPGRHHVVWLLSFFREFVSVQKGTPSSVTALWRENMPPQLRRVSRLVSLYKRRLCFSFWCFFYFNVICIREWKTGVQSHQRTSPH